jgi:CRISPR-associated endonuclease Csn1
MKKILGLDLGSTSIGWALINQAETPDERPAIISMGVRIIPLSKDESDEFSKGNAISKNADRTLKRGVRRSMHRYKMRKQFLKDVFTELMMMPSEELFRLSALELYGLRNKAVTEQVSLQEFARILFHLNQKRGYKSNRKADNEEETKSKEVATGQEDARKSKKQGYLDRIADREQLVQEQTIGQYFFHEIRKNPFFRVKENIFMRKSYEQEFDRIWETQRKFYPGILSEALRNRIRNEIIYYQRPLRSQKGLVSVCPFEGTYYNDKRKGYETKVFSGPKVIPKSSPLFQVSKIWQELNNIEITSFRAIKSLSAEIAFPNETGFNESGKRKLTLSEKQRLFNALNDGEKLTPKDILKHLGYTSGFNEYKINLRNEKFMEGNRTLADIKKVFDKNQAGFNELLAFPLETGPRVDKKTGDILVDKKTGDILVRIRSDFENTPLYKIWHLIYAAEDSETLIKVLQEKFHFSKEISEGLAKLDFHKAGYGNMSARALRNILPYLMEGDNYADACRKAGYNHSDSITTDENERRELVDKLGLYPKNSLRQPVIEKVINQVINLINELIDEKNGLITREERHAKDQFEIRIELARDLKQSAEERNKAYSRNTQQDKRHKAIIEELSGHGFTRVSRNDIERYKLWEEFGRVSPYEPNKVITLNELFNQVSGVRYDIEHIIPRALLFDDSFSNKTICPHHINKLKDKKTAYDYMHSRGNEALNDYVEFIKQHLYKKDGISKTKFNRLMMRDSDIPDDFINRQMQETRFISREIKGLLQKVCRHVSATSGTVTARLRHLWGWDDVLMNLQIDNYRSAGQTEWEEYTRHDQTHRVERIKGWTKREDHRHHAIDALSIACTRQGYIQRINTLNSQHTRDELFAEVKDHIYKEKLSLLEKYLVHQKPFEAATVQQAAAGILISFKTGKRLFSKSVNKIKKGNTVIEYRKEWIPRGFLHKETVYGRIKRFETVKLSRRFSRLEDIVDNTVRDQVVSHLENNGNDYKKAFNTKGLAQFEENNGYSLVTVYKREHVVKYKLDTYFKEKDAGSIVDQGIKRIVKKRLAEFNNNPKEAFRDLENNPIWLNKEKGVFIRSVRCFTGLSELQPLHQNEQGPIDFVSTSNNHHIAIYRDATGKRYENAVTFWDAFKRKKAGIPVIVKNPAAVWNSVIDRGLDEQNVLAKLPDQTWQYVTSMQQNELFLFGISSEELEEIKHSPVQLSKHLYRVQKISEGDYCFRHHLETKVDDKYDGIKNESLSIKLGKYKRISSMINMTGIKVKVDNLGRLTQIGEEIN